MLEPLALLLSKRKYRPLIDADMLDRLLLEGFRHDAGIELHPPAKSTILALLQWLASSDAQLGARPRPSTAHARRLTPCSAPFAARTDTPGTPLTPAHLEKIAGRIVTANSKPLDHQAICKVQPPARTRAPAPPPPASHRMP